MAYGGDKWGNFIAVSGLNSGRFLDPPEQVTFHDKGNQENVFDRVDYQFSQKGHPSLELGLHPLLVPKSKLLRRSTGYPDGMG